MKFHYGFHCRKPSKRRGWIAVALAGPFTGLVWWLCDPAMGAAAAFLSGWLTRLADDYWWPRDTKAMLTALYDNGFNDFGMRAEYTDGQHFYVMTCKRKVTADELKRDFF